MAPELQTTPCPHCGKTYTASTRICPDDGSVIEHSSPLVGQVGAVLDGKYRLDAFLSHGGMGAVYRATHVMLGKTIAVKLINPELVTSPEIVRRFQREARAATSLNHPNIVAVYDLGQTSDGTLYIAMEFVDGPSLKDAIERGRGMAPARAIELLRQVAAALSRAHRQGIVHRDLKPHNIMLAQGDDGRDQVKLVDFGIAKTFDEGTKLTSTGLPIGTPHYMPPEQASGAPVDARSDLYSVGVILFEMLTGEVPFDGEFTPAILFKHISEPPVPPSAKKPGAVPPALDEIVLRLLQKNPADRYQSADELAAALDEAALTIPASEGASPMPRTATAPRAVAGTPIQSAAASAAGPTAAPTRTPAPPPPAPAIQTTPVQRVPTDVGPTVVTPKPPARPAPAAAAPVSGPVVQSPPPAATLPAPAATLPPAAVPAASPPSNSSALVLIGFLVAGIIATVGAAYYFNGRGSSVSTEVATNNAPPTNAQATEPAASSSPQASTPSSTPTTAPPASAPSVPAAPPASLGASTPGAAASAKPPEVVSKAGPPSGPAAAAGTAILNPPPAGNPPSPRVTASAPPPPARGNAPPPQGQPGSQSARGSTVATSTAPPTGAPAAPATQASGATAQAPAAAAARREVPAAQAGPAPFPEKPAVFFRCTGPTEVCNPLRTAVDEALAGAGLAIVRRAPGADIDVEAQVEVLQQNVDRQFGTTFAVRTYSIVLNGETTKTSEVVSMPSVDNLSFDQRVGSERANERARLVAAGVVERVKEFAAKKQAR